VAGIFVLFRALKAWSQSPDSERKTGVGGEDAQPSSNDEYIARMEEELKQRN
jgi:hypothetical protein